MTAADLMAGRITRGNGGGLAVEAGAAEKGNRTAIDHTFCWHPKKCHSKHDNCKFPLHHPNDIDIIIQCMVITLKSPESSCFIAFSGNSNTRKNYLKVTQMYQKSVVLLTIIKLNQTKGGK
jgi:hypothetical protein